MKRIVCDDKTLKELLPAYQEQRLDHADQLRVDRHLMACEDCRAELDLLSLLAEDRVPDPGEAFWAALPQRIARQARTEQDRQKGLGERMRDWLVPPRWAWAAAASILLAVTTWVIVGPGSRSIGPEEHALSAASLEEDLTSEPVNMAGLSSQELVQLDSWADQELFAVRQEIDDVAVLDLRTTVEQEVFDLQKDELDRLLMLLEQRSQEVRS